MRFDRINEHQVRCTITAADLNERQISVRDMKYGSQVTMDLFREIVSEASSRYNFNADQLPVMIEAIPLSSEELLLIISAVEDAEEMDPHFARYSAVDPDGEPNAPAAPQQTFRPMEDPDIRFYAGVAAFKGIDEVMTFCRAFGSGFPGENLLYKDENRQLLYLVLLRPEDMSAKDFNVFLNRVAEYGTLIPNSQMLYSFLREHDKPVMRDPIGTLGNL